MKSLAKQQASSQQVDDRENNTVQQLNQIVVPVEI
jgi:hypothetical protein